MTQEFDVVCLGGGVAGEALAAGLQDTRLRRSRPTVEELRRDVREVPRRCRPDRDICSAEQRAAWTKSNKASFHPYGKTLAEVFAEQE